MVLIRLKHIRGWWNNPYRRTNWPEIITAFLTAAIVFVGVLQWRVYTQQKAIMESSGHQTEQLIDYARAQACAAQRNADAAASFSRSADGINTQTAKAVGEFKRLADDTERSIKSAQDNSQQALNASIAASQLDQRAWVGVQSFSGGPVVSGDQVSFAVTVVAKNTGKTPALRMSGAYIQVVTEIRDPIPDYDDVYSGRFRGPSNIYQGELFPLGDVLAPQAIRELNIGHDGAYASRKAGDGFPRIFYILGKITYDDVDGKTRHTTKFCLQNVERNQSNFSACRKGFGMD
jgi:hypothetical protein